jgi:hypothetical protein
MVSITPAARDSPKSVSVSDHELHPGACPPNISGYAAAAPPSSVMNAGRFS